MSTSEHKHSPADPSCIEVFERLSEYLEDCTHIQEHIKDCEPCVAFVESLKTSIRAAHELRVDEPVHKLDAEAQKKLKAAWQAALQRRAV